MVEETKDEFWHLADNGEGCAGPFTSIEDAKADAMTVIEEAAEYRERLPSILIVKVVAQSRTKTTHDTTWEDHNG